MRRLWCTIYYDTFDKQAQMWSLFSSTWTRICWRRDSQGGGRGREGGFIILILIVIFIVNVILVMVNVKKEVLSSLSFSLYSLSLSLSMSRRRFCHLYPFHCIRYPCHCQCQEEGFIRFLFLCICQCNFNCNFLISNDSVKIMISKYFWGIVKRFARLRSRFEKVRASEPKTVSYLVCIIKIKII